MEVYQSNYWTSHGGITVKAWRGYWDCRQYLTAFTFVVSNQRNLYRAKQNRKELYNKPCDVHLIGGKLNKNNRFFYGSETLSSIDNIYFDIAFLGAVSIGVDGIYVEDQEDSNIKKKIIERSAFVCVIADDSKFKGGLLDNIDLLITNEIPPTEILEKLKLADVKIELVEDEKNE